MLPTSIWRRPIRPLTGAVMRVYTRFSFTVSTCAWSARTAPSSWAFERSLRIELLLGNYAIFIELLKSFQIQPGIFQCGLVFEEGRLRLAELHFIGAWINFRQQFALLYLLSFSYVHFNQLAVKTALDRHGVVGLHRTQPTQQDGQIADFSLGRRHRDRHLPAAAAAFASTAFLFGIGAGIATTAQGQSDTSAHQRADGQKIRQRFRHLSSQGRIMEI